MERKRERWLECRDKEMKVKEVRGGQKKKKKNERDEEKKRQKDEKERRKRREMKVDRERGDK